MLQNVSSVPAVRNPVRDRGRKGGKCRLVSRLNPLGTFAWPGPDGLGAGAGGPDAETGDGPAPRKIGSDETEAGAGEAHAAFSSPARPGGTAAPRVSAG